MLANATNIANLFTAFDAKFNQLIQTMRPAVNLDDFAQTIPSENARYHVHAWRTRAARMQVWNGPRTLHDYGALQLQVENKPFQTGHRIKRTDVEMDRYGLFSDTVVDLAQAAVDLPILEVTSQMEAGESTLCPDGVNFYSASHPINPFAGGISGTQGNYLAGGGYALSYDNVITVRGAMRKWVGDNGINLGVNPDTLIVPSGLFDLATHIAKSPLVAPQTIGGATQVGTNSNVNGLTPENNLKVVHLPYLTEQTTWYLADTSKAYKPWFWQQLRAGAPTQLTSPGDYNVFMNNEYLLGCDLVGGASQSMWWLSHKVKGS